MANQDNPVNDSPVAGVAPADSSPRPSGLEDFFGGAEYESPNEESFSFETYKNYVLSLAQYVTAEYGALPDCFENLRKAMFGFNILPAQRIPNFSVKSLEEIKKLLFNAWNTEIVLALPRWFSKGFSKYANHWSPVQAYYSIYLALQAYYLSRGFALPRSHTRSLNMIESQICKENVLPPFWNVSCHGRLRIEECSYLNLPAAISVKQISPLATPRRNEFWHWYGMLLRTTRERQFRAKLKESANQYRTKTGEPRKRFTQEQKNDVLYKMRSTTVFDFLYRLRIRSNYEDADAFILGTMTEADADEFNEALCILNSSTLFILELHIASRIGKTLPTFVDEFLGADKKGFSKETIGLRRAYLG
jgi:hypothetical protein